MRGARSIWPSRPQPRLTNVTAADKISHVCQKPLTCSRCSPEYWFSRKVALFKGFQGEVLIGYEDGPLRPQSTR